MKPKVAIGSRWEPKRFERKDLMSYSAKNPHVDYDSAALQTVLIGTPYQRTYKRWVWWVSAAAVVSAAYIVSFI